MSTNRPNSIDAEVERQILAILYQGSRAGSWIVIAACAILVVAVILDGQQPWQTALFWFAGTTLFDASCYIHTLRWQRKPRGIDENSRGFRRFLFVTIGEASSWAIGILLFMPKASHELRFFILTLVTGIVAGAVPMLAGNLRLIDINAGIILSAVLLALASHSLSPIDYMLLPGVIIYAFVIFKSSRQFNDSLVKSLRLSLERQELLDSLRSAHAETARASQAKSEFLANISHEIRTPVSTIISSSELALNSSGTPVNNTHLTLIHRTAHTLLQVLNGILDFSRIEANMLKADRIPFRLADVLNTLEAIFGQAAEEKGLHLEVKRSSTLPVCIEGDPVRLHQVLANLLSNAIKFTSSGLVTLTAERSPNASDDGQIYILFSVKDTGIGIDKPQRSRIFEAFAQADTSASRRFGGTGLGLTIARDLTLLMGGSGLELISTRGLGSLFSFTLPFGWLPDDAVRPAEQEIPKFPESECNGRHILLADDTEDNQDFFSTVLTRAGYQVSIASNGSEALRLCAIQTFYAVLMDVHMPIMDGLEATRRIREREQALELPYTPIVALTADIGEKSTVDCLAAGMDGHIVRPVKVSAMLELLERLQEKVHSRS